MEDKEKQEKVFDILNKFEFFHGQRAGRELWNDKPKEVQDKDISDFIKDINYIRSYLQDSVVLSVEEYEMLVNQYKNLEIKYSNLCDNYRLCKDANETLKQNIIITRNETAEKILRDLYSEATSNVGETVELTTFQIEQLAKQFGVKIKE